MSVKSTVSVSIRGEDVDCEKALKDTVKDLQGHLNALEVIFMQIATTSEQFVGDEVEVDSKEFGKLTISQDLLVSCKQVDAMQEEIVKMNGLFDDLMSMSMQLVYEPETKDEKLYVREYKKIRKVEVQKMKDKLKEERESWHKQLKEERKNEKKENKN